jgi:hypothetical protein
MDLPADPRTLGCVLLTRPFSSNHCSGLLILICCNGRADPSREEDAAREAPFPFTTIQPNIGRGHIVLPDPAPLLGFTAETAQPAHGYALGGIVAVAVVCQLRGCSVTSPAGMCSQEADSTATPHARL